MPEIQTPEWAKDAIFYQIVPDRFAKSDAVPKASGLQPWGAPPTPHGYAMRNCATDARASPPLMSGTILNSSAVTPARSTA